MCNNDICKSWNKAIRKVWKLPPTAHTCILGPLNWQLHILDQIVICFMSSDISIVIFITFMWIFAIHVYSFFGAGEGGLRKCMVCTLMKMLYIKWKYDIDITTTQIQLFIKCVYDTGQENAQILQYVNMMQ